MSIESADDGLRGEALLQTVASFIKDEEVRRSNGMVATKHPSDGGALPKAQPSEVRSSPPGPPPGPQRRPRAPRAVASTYQTQPPGPSDSGAKRSPRLSPRFFRRDPSAVDPGNNRPQPLAAEPLRDRSPEPFLSKFSFRRRRVDGEPSPQPSPRQMSPMRSPRAFFANIARGRAKPSTPDASAHSGDLWPQPAAGNSGRAGPCEDQPGGRPRAHGAQASPVSSSPRSASPLRRFFMQSPRADQTKTSSADAILAALHEKIQRTGRSQRCTPERAQQDADLAQKGPWDTARHMTAARATSATPKLPTNGPSAQQGQARELAGADAATRVTYSLLAAQQQATGGKRRPARKTGAAAKDSGGRIGGAPSHVSGISSYADLCSRPAYQDLISKSDVDLRSKPRANKKGPKQRKKAPCAAAQSPATPPADKKPAAATTWEGGRTVQLQSVADQVAEILQQTSTPAAAAAAASASGQHTPLEGSERGGSRWGSLLGRRLSPRFVSSSPRDSGGSPRSWSPRHIRAPSMATMCGGKTLGGVDAGSRPNGATAPMCDFSAGEHQQVSMSESPLNSFSWVSTGVHSPYGANSQRLIFSGLMMDLEDNSSSFNSSCSHQLRQLSDSSVAACSSLPCLSGTKRTAGTTLHLRSTSAPAEGNDMDVDLPMPPPPAGPAARAQQQAVLALEAIAAGAADVLPAPPCLQIPDNLSDFFVEMQTARHRTDETDSVVYSDTMDALERTSESTAHADHSSVSATALEPIPPAGLRLGGQGAASNSLPATPGTDDSPATQGVHSSGQSPATPAGADRPLPLACCRAEGVRLTEPGGDSNVRLSVVIPSSPMAFGHNSAGGGAVSLTPLSAASSAARRYEHTLQLPTGSSLLEDSTDDIDAVACAVSPVGLLLSPAEALEGCELLRCGPRPLLRGPGGPGVPKGLGDGSSGRSLCRRPQTPLPPVISAAGVGADVIRAAAYWQVFGRSGDCRPLSSRAEVGRGLLCAWAIGAVHSHLRGEVSSGRFPPEIPPERLPHLLKASLVARVLQTAGVSTALAGWELKVASGRSCGQGHIGPGLMTDTPLQKFPVVVVPTPVKTPVAAQQPASSPARESDGRGTANGFKSPRLLRPKQLLRDMTRAFRRGRTPPRQPEADEERILNDAPPQPGPNFLRHAQALEARPRDRATASPQRQVAPATQRHPQPDLVVHVLAAAGQGAKQGATGRPFSPGSSGIQKKSVTSGRSPQLRFMSPPRPHQTPTPASPTLTLV